MLSLVQRPHQRPPSTGVEYIVELASTYFDPPLHGLVMADVEFSTDQEAQSFPQPPAKIAEVTNDSGSPEAASSGLAVATCLPGSPSTASNPSRSSELNSSTGIDNCSIRRLRRV